MRSIVKKLLTLTLATLLVFSCIGCNKNNTGNEELDQWDYFSEYVGYYLYTTDTEHKDYQAWQGWGQILDSYSNYSIKEPITKIDWLPSLVKNFLQFRILPTDKVDEIELRKFTIGIGSVVAQNIGFDIRIGSNFIKSVEVNLVAGEITEMEVVFSPKIWDKGSKLAIILDLKAPNLVQPYFLHSLKMDIEKK